MGKYRCTVCGYVYEPGVPFKELPEDWVCPTCGAGKDKFSAEVEAAAAPVTRTYSNGEITVLWQPALCNHNGNCTRSLPQVFNTKARPWVDIKAAGSEAIAKVVGQCPTGALSVTWEKV